jgi:antitoxin Phd
MKSWAVQDAKARFGEMLVACLRQGPLLVTKRGAEAAVLVPIEDWRRLQGRSIRRLKELLLTDEARGRYRASSAPAWARLMHRKSDTLADDARIAATALVHGLVVVTRNVRVFQPFKVQTFNPFIASP